MPNIELIRLDPAVENEIASDREYQQAMAEENWPRLAEAVLRVVGRTAAPPPDALDQRHWGGYLAVNSESREIVGSCAYKTPPTDDGSIEIAYFTYPGFEGRGFATMMAGRLIEVARLSRAVRRVIAHTLPETNASTRVLQKVGMDFVGEVIEPDDGRVWRWQLTIGD